MTDKRGPAGCEIRMKFADTLEGHRGGILAWHEHRISAGPLEGVDNKIKTLKRAAYGYRNQEDFKLKMLAIHRPQYAIIR